MLQILTPEEQVKEKVIPGRKFKEKSRILCIKKNIFDKEELFLIECEFKEFRKK